MASILKSTYTCFSRLFAMLGIATLIALPCLAAQAQQSSMVTIGKENWLFPGWGSLTEVDHAGIRDNTRLITATRDALAKLDITLVMLVLPDKALFYEDKLPDGTKLSDAVRARYKDIMAQLQQSGIATFDAEAVLRSVQAEGQPVYYHTDQHWTQPAADAAAQASAELIKKLTTLKGQDGSGTPLGGLVNERRFGDLAELFLAPEQRKQVGRETFIVRRQAQSQGLVDDTDIPAPVHVTGHSMVQPYFGYPQMLSNALDRPVSLNWKPGNVGPWIILLEYLESPAFKQRRPQVLVWQMFEPTYDKGPQARGSWDNDAIMSNDAWLSRMNAATAR